MKIADRIQLILRTKGGHSTGNRFKLTDREEIFAEAIDREFDDRFGGHKTPSKTPDCE